MSDTFATSTATLEAPINDFRQCHQGIFKKLDSLSALIDLLPSVQKARQIAEQSVEFFREAIFEHHLDEERELFPAVVAGAKDDEERGRVRQIVDRLTEEHRELERLWKSLESDLKRVSKGKEADVDLDAIAALTVRYKAHAEYEETVFLPLSETILARNPNGMAALGLSLHMRHTPLRVVGFV